ncbi:MAG: helix-turn-helix transcriptional regulator [Clostridia bacterium]|nr:helix-turn-helix transcriptional regulator [Clostridia bacterium]
MFYDNYIRMCNSVNKSPSAVALEIGIAKPTVNRWKNGSRPTDATVQRIADYFNVSTDALLGIQEEETKKAPTPEGERDYLAIMNAFDKADETTREAILLLLKLK